MRTGLFALAALAASLSAQPVIDTAGNAADPLKGDNVLAPGSFITLKGNGLGPSSPQVITPFQDSVAGVSVSIKSGSNTFPALLYYISATQINAVLPSTTPPGAASIAVTYNGQTSAAFDVVVAKTGFNAFTWNSNGDGQAVSVVVSPDGSYALGFLANPIRPGQAVSLYGTGLGAFAKDDTSAPGFLPTASTVRVTIGGISVTPAYAGRAPEFPAEDQITFVMPDGVPAGCYTPAVVTVDGVPSNDFVLATGPAGSSGCTHPFGLSLDAEKKLDAGGTVNIGAFMLLEAAVQGLPIEGAGGLFDQANASAVYETYTRIVQSFGGAPLYPVPANSCAVYDEAQNRASFAIPDFSQIGGKELQADANLTLAQAGSSPFEIPRAPTGGYLSPPFAVIVGQGDWTLSGSGGPDIGAFSAKITLPQDLKWAANFSNVPRTDLTITWTGGGTSVAPNISIVGGSAAFNQTDPTQSRAKAFVCTAPASAGTFRIPAAIVSQLPSTPTAGATGVSGFGYLGIVTGGGTSFTAPLTAGGQIDGGFIGFGEANVINVVYQ